MSDFPGFDTFFRHLHGYPPLPWQSRLARRIDVEGWPAEITVPTGLGKTACIDMALWALARAADRGSERNAPTRVWYVVNRRLLVDAAYERGLALQAALADPRSLGRGEATRDVGLVAEALNSLSAFNCEDGPLFVARYRGGADMGVRAPDPSMPALLFATVPMFASRWLFQGYGSSASMRPVDAALAGIDSLVLLDEAHLAEPLVHLDEVVAQCDLGDPSYLVPSARARPLFVSMTATGRGGRERFDLDDDDRIHPLVARRLQASKPVTLRTTSRQKLARDLARAAVECFTLAGVAISCVVFCNTPRTARLVLDESRRLLAKASIRTRCLLLTGRVREHEAKRLRTEVLDEERGAPAGRGRGDREENLLVVATQTLEVGADLDFDALVSETAGVRSLTQRFGRLNRLGEKDSARATLLHLDDVDEWPVYGREPATVWKRLQEFAEEESADLCPGQVAQILGEPDDRPARMGELLPVHLWEWAKTSAPPPDAAPLEPFIAGIEEEAARVSLCWRAYIPEEGARLFPEVTEYESIELPLWEVRDALGEDLTHVHRLGLERSSLERVALSDIKPGDHLVLDLATGRYDQLGWNPAATDPVVDVSPVRSRALLLVPEAVANLVAAPPPSRVLELVDALASPPEEEDDDFQADEAVLVEELIDELNNVDCVLGDNAWWHEFLRGLQRYVVRPVGEISYIPPKPVVGAPGRLLRAEAFEELSFDVRTTPLLDEHLAGVSEAAGRIAQCLGLPEEVCAALKVAGRYHDIGKLDARFQRWLDPGGTASAALAKSFLPRERKEAARIAAEWPRGGRHEILSARLVDAYVKGWDEVVPWDGDLVLHLVLAHHGQGRPSHRIVEDPLRLAVTATVEGRRVSVVADLSCHDWEQPERFRRLCARFGYWGVALLEAILRQADHVVSRATEVI